MVRSKASLFRATMRFCDGRNCVTFDGRAGQVLYAGGSAAGSYGSSSNQRSDTERRDKWGFRSDQPNGWRCIAAN